MPFCFQVKSLCGTDGRMGRTHNAAHLDGCITLGASLLM